MVKIVKWTVIICLTMLFGALPAWIIASHKQIALRSKAMDAAWIALVGSVDLAAEQVRESSSKLEAAGAIKTFIGCLERNREVIEDSVMLGETFYNRQMYINHARLGGIYRDIDKENAAMVHFAFAAKSQGESIRSLTPEQILRDLDKMHELENDEDATSCQH